MKKLLIVAHGSRREASNDEIRSLAKKVSESARLDSNNVQVAFLEFASPSITEAVDACFNDGTEVLMLLPYFLSAGNHVVEDIPREVCKALEKWPEKTISILPHIGGAESMPNLIAQTLI
jgi:sirohydrochlorin ferrochelatase